jgi:hypothetical protein
MTNIPKAELQICSELSFIDSFPDFGVSQSFTRENIGNLLTGNLGNRKPQLETYYP